MYNNNRRGNRETEQIGLVIKYESKDKLVITTISNFKMIDWVEKEFKRNRNHYDFLIRYFARKAGERFSNIETRLSGVEGGLGGVEYKLDRVEYRLDCVEYRLDRVENRLGGIEYRLGNVELRLCSLEKKTSLMDKKLDYIVGYIKKLDSKIDQLSKNSLTSS